ncbi:MAG TPA: M23 family metallopeptidase [Roseomonas sp.]|jgi:murein DD-endopeptidase MepM/ murein hydrolase activator NlpD
MRRTIAILLTASLYAAPALAEAPRLALPFRPACVSSPFGERAPGGGPRASRFHTGTDLPASAGTWVQAAAAGQVTFIRRLGAAGLEVEIRHAGGITTRYAHLGTVAPTLASGRRVVAQGERIGRIGRTGITYGTHLHFELLIDDVRQDAAPHLGVLPCRRQPAP